MGHRRSVISNHTILTCSQHPDVERKLLQSERTWRMFQVPGQTMERQELNLAAHETSDTTYIGRERQLVVIRQQNRNVNGRPPKTIVKMSDRTSSI
jgi:hypothetical protein